jgi:capsular exopolysaccharide synthesis family protein
MSERAELPGDFRLSLRKPLTIRLADDGDGRTSYNGTLVVLACDGIACSVGLPPLAPGTEVIVGLKVPEWGILPCRLDLPAAIEHQNGAHCTLRFRTFDEKLSKRFRAYARRALSAREKLQSSQGRSSALVEAFRMVRANLEPTDRTRVLLVTSSVSGEGKTFVASGLAIVLASEGRRVLLVDADLYRPSLHRAFGLELVSGVARLLAEGNRIRLSDLTQEPRPGLAVLTGGDGNAIPSALYAPTAVTALIEVFRLGGFDIVIMDSPPLLETAGAIALARAADEVLVTIRSGRSRRRDVRQAKALLRRNKVTLGGVVLNDYEGSAPSYAHGYVRPRADVGDPPDGSGEDALDLALQRSSGRHA